MASRSATYSKKKLQRFACVFVAAFIFLFAIIPFLRHPSNGFNSIILVLGLIVVLVAFLSPYSLRKPYAYWLKIGDILASFNSKLILGIFFFGVVSPLAIFARAARNVINLIPKQTSKSTYRLEPAAQVSSFSDQH